MEVKELSKGLVVVENGLPGLHDFSEVKWAAVLTLKIHERCLLAGTARWFSHSGKGTYNLHVA